MITRPFETAGITQRRSVAGCSYALETLLMKATGCFKTSGTAFPTMQCHISEDRKPLILLLFLLLLLLLLLHLRLHLSSSSSPPPPSSSSSPPPPYSAPSSHSSPPPSPPPHSPPSRHPSPPPPSSIGITAHCGL